MSAGGRADGRTAGAQPRLGGRADGRAGGKDNLNDSTTIFIDFNKTTKKTVCFSVVSHPAEAQVPIFTAQMKTASNKCQKSNMFFDFQITRERKYRFLHLKCKKNGTRPLCPVCPVEHPEMGFSTPLAT